MIATTAAVKIVFIVTCLAVTNAIELKVGIYNSIPDVGGDDLASYKKLIEDRYTLEYSSNTVDAVVNESLYDPYGDLADYLTNDDFDILEIDTTSLPGLIEKGLIVPMNDVVSSMNNIFPEALEAVEYDNQYYAYPTLLCGNFLIGLSPASSSTCDLESARDTYTDFENTLTECEKLHSSYPTYERLLGGKMNDVYGYYLPDMYIDGYIDMYGSDKAQEAIDNVLSGVVDMGLCSRLTEYAGGCRDKTGPPPHNKCYYSYTDSYVESSSNVYADITENKTMLYFGFSEKLGLIKKDNPGIEAYTAISAPMGDSSYLLQYTDALVVSLESWNESNEKKQAIIDFVNFFTGLGLREAIMFGMDLSPPTTRYLLQANQLVYSTQKAIDDPIIDDLKWALDRGIHTPLTDTSLRARMQEMLTYRGCVCGCNEGNGDLPFKKKAATDSCLADKEDCKRGG